MCVTFIPYNTGPLAIIAFVSHVAKVILVIIVPVPSGKLRMYCIAVYTL